MYTQSTKSKKQAQIEETQIDTLATISSPVGPKLSLKKLTPVSESTKSPKKQALPPVNLTLSKGGIVASIVTATKTKESQNKSSEDESPIRSAKQKNK